MASVSVDAARTAQAPVTIRSVSRRVGNPTARASRGVVPQSSRPAAADTFARRSSDGFPPNLEAVGALDARYLTQASRAKTLVICGGSKSTPAMSRYESVARELAFKVVSAGGNVVTGNGKNGVMGAAFAGAAAAAKADGSGENLTVVKMPAWGDEDFVNGRAIAKAQSEEERFDLFQRVGARVVYMPGAVGTLLELAKGIEGVVAPRAGMPPFERIFVVDGGQFFAGMQQQLDQLVAAGIMKPELRARIEFVRCEDIVAHALPPSLMKA